MQACFSECSTRGRRTTVRDRVSFLRHLTRPLGAANLKTHKFSYITPALLRRSSTARSSLRCTLARAVRRTMCASWCRRRSLALLLARGAGVRLRGNGVWTERAIGGLRLLRAYCESQIVLALCAGPRSNINVYLTSSQMAETPQF